MENTMRKLIKVNSQMFEIDIFLAKGTIFVVCGCLSLLIGIQITNKPVYIATEVISMIT